jgi:hypothetical protein
MFRYPLRRYEDDGSSPILPNKSFYVLLPVRGFIRDHCSDVTKVTEMVLLHSETATDESGLGDTLPAYIITDKK